MWILHFCKSIKKVSETKKEIEIKFSGNGITPESVSTSEIFEVCSVYEETLRAYMLKHSPNISIENFTFSLVQVKESSAIYTLKTIAIAAHAAIAINTAIQNEDYAKLPYNSIEGIRKLWNFSKKRNCDVSLSAKDKEKVSLGFITPLKEINLPKNYVIKGETTIYGEIIRAGGIEPKIRIKLQDNEILSVKVTEDLAKELALRLYDIVGLKGNAKWNKEDLSLEDFTITEILPYKKTPFPSAFDKLKSVLGTKWNEIGDVNNYIENLRYHD